MPMPQHCIDCDKIATVLNDKVPYCAECYTKEKRSQKPIHRAGHLFNTETKS